LRHQFLSFFFQFLELEVDLVLGFSFPEKEVQDFGSFTPQFELRRINPGQETKCVLSGLEGEFFLEEDPVAIDFNPSNLCPAQRDEEKKKDQDQSLHVFSF
jgi:hypothetical protein